MPQPPGTVSVNGSGVASGSGIAFDLYTERLAQNDAFLTSTGFTVPSNASRVPFLKYLAFQSQADANVLGPLLP